MNHIIKWCILPIVIIQTFVLGIPLDPEAGKRTPEIIKRWGYPVEIHNATTDDGYILTLHRIPYGKKSGPSTTKKPVVFLQHGLLASSSNWISNLPNLAFGYLLADAGYDVWMGNVRGNIYSLGHNKYDTKSHEYWSFSWDEMAQSDLPAMIDKALEVTNHQSLYYVGHSQGTLIMFTKLSENEPKFVNKIRKFFALAPVCTVKYIQGLLELLAKDFYDTFDIMEKTLGDGPFLEDDKLLQTAEKLFCDESQQEEDMCKSFLLLIGGTNSTQINATRIPVFLSDEPGGTSLKNILHWAQMTRSGKLQKYNYEDPFKNLQHYGKMNPPLYDIGNINSDVHLFWSAADWLADEKDIDGFLLKNINQNSLKENKKLIDFEHMDFTWGNRAAAEVYQPIINEIQKDISINGDP